MGRKCEMLPGVEEVSACSVSASSNSDSVIMQFDRGRIEIELHRGQVTWLIVALAQGLNCMMSYSLGSTFSAFEPDDYNPDEDPDYDGDDDDDDGSDLEPVEPDVPSATSRGQRPRKSDRI